MSLQLSFEPCTLQFTFSAGTSRGTLTSRKTWILTVWDTKDATVKGRGEAGPLPGLSVDDRPDFEARLQETALRVQRSGLTADTVSPSEAAALWVPVELPSIRMGLEMALLDLVHGGRGVYFDNAFTRGSHAIPMNGLIWMGDYDFMARQVDTKLAEGFRTIKMKIGAIDPEQEYRLLEQVRHRYPAGEIALRVDANGAFSAADAMARLHRLAGYDLHSIEQPIRQGQAGEMSRLAEASPVPVALDEELIGVTGQEARIKLLETIRPAFIVLKPTLLGGFAATHEWISAAETLGIGWWITSALESNIGLNAIAQFTAAYDNPLPQGLGTGRLYHWNFPSPLFIEKGCLYYKG